MFKGLRYSNYFQLGLALCLAGQMLLANATVDAAMTGKQLMERVYDRHQQFPYIYEEQSLVMEDDSGRRDTRRAKRYTRVEQDGTLKFLLLFDYPEEIRGVALLAQRTPNGDTTRHVYLPALGEFMNETVGAEGEGNFLGTDFSVEDLTGEELSQYNYTRREDTKIDAIDFHVVDVFEKSDVFEKPGQSELPVRRHFIRQDSLYITLTHHYDRLGRISRLQSQHDLRPVAGDMWRADMILMIDKKADHQSLIKVSRRVYSKDYVPEEVFTADWLFSQYPYIEPTIGDGEDELSMDLPIAESPLAESPLVEKSPLQLAQQEPIE